MTQSTPSSSTPLDQPNWLPTLRPQVELLQQLSSNLNEVRKEFLDQAANEIVEASRSNGMILLNFICTHNSRRSHLAQLWANVAAEAYRLKQVECYSGGTEATACNHRVVRSLRSAGLSVVTPDPLDRNPVYLVQYAEDRPPIALHSKCYDDTNNPSSDFHAMMCCSDVDDRCPVIAGSSTRIALHYRDPKESDDTPQESETYDQRRDEIGAEMFYLLKQIARQN